MPDSNLPSPYDNMLKPTLMLFMSVDVINSTAYKSQTEPHQTLNSVNPWIQFFLDFFKDFPQMLKEAVSRLDGVSSTPSVWKSMGDELIVYVPLKNYQEPLLYLSAFKDAVNKYVSAIRKKSLKSNLSLKATAWIAGFPVMNAQVPIVNLDNKLSFDFIGPNIDLGFRLCRFSDRRKFVISLDLAYMLAEDLSRNTPSRQVRLHYDGREELKGVLGGEKYPVFWIDMFDGTPDKEMLPHEKLEKEFLPKRESSEIKREALQQFAKSYLESLGGRFIIPFIDGDEVFGNRPDKYVDYLEQVKGLYRDLDLEQYKSGPQKSSKRAKKTSDLITASLSVKPVTNKNMG